METQRQDKRKIPTWARIVIYIVLFFLIGLSLAWLSGKLGIIPQSWSDNLLKIFPFIFGLLGTVFDKDSRQLILQRLLGKPSDDSEAAKDSSTPPSLVSQPAVSITFTPNITVSPNVQLSSSQNAFSGSPSVQVDSFGSDADTLRSHAPSIDPQEETSAVDELPEQALNATKHTVTDTTFVNPDQVFLFNSSLPHPKELFGRVLERNILLSRTRNGSSTSIVGTRRIGKSWLIGYLRLVAKDQLGLSFRIGYLDATAPSCAMVAGFTAEALDGLGVFSSSSDPSMLGLAVLEKTVKELKLRHEVPVLCIDEFEGFGNRQVFNLSFFTGLRAMTQMGLVLITASKKPLLDIIGSNGETSGFFNVFEQLTLKPFDAEVAREFVQTKRTQAGFTEQECNALLEYGQDENIEGERRWPPVRLQLVGKMLLWDKSLHHSHSDYTQVPNYWQEFKARLDEKYHGVVQ